MNMAINAAGLNYMLDQLATGGKIAYMALFTDDAATVEVSGGSPAYARKAITWAAAAGGVKALNGTLPAFDVPACTVKAVAFYDALTAGTQYAMYNSTDEVFASQGIYSITSGSITST
jgi:hypothetical protein